MPSEGNSSGVLGTSARLAFGGLSIALALLIAAWTPVISPDSTYYLDTARQLAEGRGPVTFALHLGMPAVPSPAGFWPNLYPSVLGAALSLGLPPERAPALVNAVSVIALCLVLVRIGRRCLPPGWAWPAALLGVAHPLYASTLVSAWSEALFTVFVYAGLAVALDLQRSSTLPLKKCAAAGLLAGAAFATRYAGLFLLGHLVAAIGFLAWRRRWGPAATARGFAVVVGAFAVLAIPASYPNVRAYGSVFGMPRPPHPSIAQAALDRGRELAIAGGWLWLQAAALVALVVTVSLVARARKVSSDEPGRPGAGAWLLGGWIAFYLCALFASLLPYVRSDQLNGRFLAPVAPAAVLCMVRWLARARAPAGAPVAALSSLLALASFAHAAHEYLPGSGRADPVASWARDHSSETSLFVGTGLWDLRFRTGAIVLTDGFPEMPRLEPGAVRDFLGDQGARFRTVHLVLGGAATTSSFSSVSYERALQAVGFHSRRTAALEDGSTVLTLERTDGPWSRAGGPGDDRGLLPAVRPSLVRVSPVR